LRLQNAESIHALRSAHLDEAHAPAALLSIDAGYVDAAAAGTRQRYEWRCIELFRKRCVDADAPPGAQPHFAIRIQGDEA
jgi:hypothetical protein